MNGRERSKKGWIMRLAASMRAEAPSPPPASRKKQTTPAFHHMDGLERWKGWLPLFFSSVFFLASLSLNKRMAEKEEGEERRMNAKSISAGAESEILHSNEKKLYACKWNGSACVGEPGQRKGWLWLWLTLFVCVSQWMASTGFLLLPMGMKFSLNITACVCVCHHVSHTMNGSIFCASLAQNAYHVCVGPLSLLSLILRWPTRWAHFLLWCCCFGSSLIFPLFVNPTHSKNQRLEAPDSVSSLRFLLTVSANFFSLHLQDHSQPLGGAFTYTWRDWGWRCNNINIRGPGIVNAIAFDNRTCKERCRTNRDLVGWKKFHGSKIFGWKISKNSTLLEIFFWIFSWNFFIKSFDRIFFREFSQLTESWMFVQLSLHTHGKQEERVSLWFHFSSSFVWVSGALPPRWNELSRPGSPGGGE